MKLMVKKLLGIVMMFVIILSLILNCCLQLKRVQGNMDESSQELFWQINQILNQNTIELEEIKKDFTAQCLRMARSAAYLVQHNPSILNDKDEINKVAKLLDIDELHIFNTEGLLYAGSEPRYFGYSFSSGEQMAFFKPLIKNRNLELCQEITPNTAEGKLMQYAAVWREDGKGIVQIGLEPNRVMEATKKNELSYIFSLLTADSGAVMYAVDTENHEILGSTKSDFVGKKLEDIGIDPHKINLDGKGFHTKLNDNWSYFTFLKSDSILLGRSYPVETLYSGINIDTLYLGVYLFIIAGVMILVISKYLDEKIIKGIDLVNRKLKKITNGALDERIDVNTTPEFLELSGHINQMVKSICDTTDKISYALDFARMPIGIYEYGTGMSRVRVTKRVPQILALSKDEEKNYYLIRFYLNKGLIQYVKMCLMIMRIFINQIINI